MPKFVDLGMKLMVGSLIGMTGYGIFATTTSLYALKQFNKQYDLDMKRKKEEEEEEEEVQKKNE